MPPGDEVTVPVPAPDLVTMSDSWSPKFAVTSWSELAVTMHVPVPVQPAPVQPRNTELGCATAVSATCVPSGTVREQVPGQLSPAGVELTAPAPLPAVTTAMV